MLLVLNTASMYVGLLIFFNSSNFEYPPPKSWARPWLCGVVGVAREVALVAGGAAMGSGDAGTVAARATREVAGEAGGAASVALHAVREPAQLGPEGAASAAWPRRWSPPRARRRPPRRRSGRRPGRWTTASPRTKGIMGRLPPWLTSSSSWIYSSSSW